VDGWGSSVDGIGFNHPGYDTQVKVSSINFSKFLQTLPENSNIICKMDIEGSEFKVLRHLIEQGTISKIKEIYIEFHERFMPLESKHTEDELMQQISSFGVKVNTWF
jgi:hypothetical protein